MRVIFVRMRNRDCEQTHLFQFALLWDFGPYCGLKICSCGSLRNVRLESAVREGMALGLKQKAKIKDGTRDESCWTAATQVSVSDL